MQHKAEASIPLSGGGGGVNAEEAGETARREVQHGDVRWKRTGPVSEPIRSVERGGALRARPPHLCGAVSASRCPQVTSVRPL